MAFIISDVCYDVIKHNNPIPLSCNEKTSLANAYKSDGFTRKYNSWIRATIAGKPKCCKSLMMHYRLVNV